MTLASDALLDGLLVLDVLEQNVEKANRLFRSGLVPPLSSAEATIWRWT